MDALIKRLEALEAVTPKCLVCERPAFMLFVAGRPAPLCPDCRTDARRDLPTDDWRRAEYNFVQWLNNKRSSRGTEWAAPFFGWWED